MMKNRDKQVKEYFKLAQHAIAAQLECLEKKIVPVPKRNRTHCVLSKNICKDAFKIIIRIATEMLKQFPNDNIVCLGRSPMWAIESANLIKQYSKAGRLGAHFQYCAFSGCFYTLKNSQYEHAETLPNESQINAYRQYLTENNLDPTSIIKANKNNRKTVFVEYIQSGRGLISFLSILLNWAKELNLKNALIKSIHLHLLISQPSIAVLVGKQNTSPLLNENCYSYQGIPITKHPLPRRFIGGADIYPKEKEKTEENKEYIAGLSFIDRYFEGSTPGTTFEHKDWGNVTPQKLGEEYSKLAMLIRFALIDELAKQNLVYKKSFLGL